MPVGINIDICREIKCNLFYEVEHRDFFGKNTMNGRCNFVSCYSEKGNHHICPLPKQCPSKALHIGYDGYYGACAYAGGNCLENAV